MRLTKKQRESYESYILENIDFENYDLKVTPKTDKEKLQFLHDTFVKEYWFKNNQLRFKLNKEACFSEWLQGLPSSINIVFTNYDILQLAKKYGSLAENPTERQENEIIYNYFKFIANLTFKLFRKHKIDKLFTIYERGMK